MVLAGGRNTQRAVHHQLHECGGTLCFGLACLPSLQEALVQKQASYPGEIGRKKRILKVPRFQNFEPPIAQLAPEQAARQR